MIITKVFLTGLLLMVAGFNFAKSTTWIQIPGVMYFTGSCITFISSLIFIWIY
jgi:hypothetical protein